MIWRNYNFAIKLIDDSINLESFAAWIKKNNPKKIYLKSLSPFSIPDAMLWLDLDDLNSTTTTSTTYTTSTTTADVVTWPRWSQIYNNNLYNNNNRPGRDVVAWLRRSQFYNNNIYNNITYNNNILNNNILKNNNSWLDLVVVTWQQYQHNIDSRWSKFYYIHIYYNNNNSWPQSDVATKFRRSQLYKTTANRVML